MSKKPTNNENSSPVSVFNFFSSCEREKPLRFQFTKEFKMVHQWKRRPGSSLINLQIAAPNARHVGSTGPNSSTETRLQYHGFKSPSKALWLELGSLAVAKTSSPFFHAYCLLL